MNKRIAAFLLVLVTMLSVAASASAKAIGGDSVFDKPAQKSK